jgi:hypothetical protein
MSAARIVAVNCVAEPNVVALSVPFHRTTELLMKLEPVTVSVNPAPPAIAEVGLILVRPGTGLAAVIVKFTPLDVPPPGAGLNTVTLAVPAVAMSAARIVAVNWVALT